MERDMGAARRMTRGAVLAGMSALLLGGCQTWGPTWSELTGEVWNRTIQWREPAVIERVDGRTPDTSSRPIRVEPGNGRVVTISPVNSARRISGWRLEEIKLDIEPCKRYFINAQFTGPRDPDFTPVIDRVETIAGCKMP